MKKIQNDDNIKKKKKNKLKENINKLEDLLNGLDDSIKKIKISFEKINEDKEELKMKIQKIFTKIRNELNDREDKLLSELDEIFNKSYFNEQLIKESEKLPNKVKLSIEKGKKIENDWNDNYLNILINDCINIENNIKEINTIKEGIQKINSNKKFLIDFTPDKDEEINKFLEKIKTFGILNFNPGEYRNIIINSNIIQSTNEIQFIIERLKNKENAKNISLDYYFKLLKMENLVQIFIESVMEK